MLEWPFPVGRGGRETVSMRSASRTVGGGGRGCVRGGHALLLLSDCRSKHTKRSAGWAGCGVDKPAVTFGSHSVPVDPVRLVKRRNWNLSL